MPAPLVSKKKYNKAMDELNRLRRIVYRFYINTDPNDAYKLGESGVDTYHAGMCERMRRNNQ